MIEAFEWLTYISINVLLLSVATLWTKEPEDQFSRRIISSGAVKGVK